MFVSPNQWLVGGHLEGRGLTSFRSEGNFQGQILSLVYKMSPIIVVIALFLFVFIIFFSYQIGRRIGSAQAAEEDFRRPVNTYLYYKAPVVIKEELASGLRVTAVRGIPIPDTFDARQKWPNSIGEALDQGTCGSCWAFASATAITDRFRIAEPSNEELRQRFHYRPFVDPPTDYVVMNSLSPYELVSCDICSLTQNILPETADYVAGADEECDMGCEGGYITHVYKYIAEQGVSAIICNPPTCDPNDPPGNDCNCERKQECRIYKPRNAYGLFEGADDKETRRRKIMEDIFTYGPITTGFTVYNSFYQFFKQNPTGVYTTESQPPGDLPIGGHAVVVLGWGTDEATGVFYWLARNSWGINWGDQGFFKIQYDWGDFLEPIWMGARI